jgi:hypothetical protein
MTPSRPWLDGLLALLLFGLVVLLAAEAWDVAHGRAERRAVTAEARALYDALEQYRTRHGAYPGATEPPGLAPASLEPLRRRGYYHGFLPAKLLGRQIDAYAANAAGEFWLEMTLEADPDVRILVARSDEAPMSAGSWREGVFVWTGDALETP